MPTYRVVYKNRSPAPGIKVSVSFGGGGMKTGLTDKNGYVTISGSSSNGKIYIDGKERHHGSLASNMEFML